MSRAITRSPARLSSARWPGQRRRRRAGVLLLRGPKGRKSAPSAWKAPFAQLHVEILLTIRASSRASSTVATAGRRPRPSARPRDQLTVRSRHLAVRQVEVVLQPDAHVAAERERRRDERHCAAADADHPPLVRHRDLLGHVGEVARVGRMPPGTPMTKEN